MNILKATIALITIIGTSSPVSADYPNFYDFEKKCQQEEADRKQAQEEKAKLEGSLGFRYEDLVSYVHRAPQHIDFPILSKDFKVIRSADTKESSFSSTFCAGTVLCGKFTEPDHAVTNICISTRTSAGEFWTVGSWISSRFFDHGSVLDHLASQFHYSPYHLAWASTGQSNGSTVLVRVPNPLPVEPFLASCNNGTSPDDDFELVVEKGKGIRFSITPSKYQHER